MNVLWSLPVLASVVFPVSRVVTDRDPSLLDRLRWLDPYPLLLDNVLRSGR